MVKKNNFFILFFLIIFLLPSILGLCHIGFPVTDDGGWMIIRFSAFYEVLRHGQFPVRFLMRLNNSYGYPVADFLYPLFMYLGVPIHLAGFGFINTIKIILGGSLLLSGLGCFFWLRKLFGIVAAFVGAIAYTFFPYHLFDVYQRGSVGEVVALGIVPFIFWQIEEKHWVFIALGIALLILAHNSLALLFLPIFILYIFVKKIGSIQDIFFTLCLGVLLAAFFWLPALYDKQFTIFDRTSVSDFSHYFLTIKNIGLAGLFVLLVSVLGSVTFFKKSNKDTVFFLGITYIGLFFSFSSSSFLWKLLPLPQLVQFPFRFLSIVMVGIAFLSASLIATAKTSVRIFLAGVFICFIYIAAWQYLFPKAYQTYPDSYYSTNQDTTTVKNEYMPTSVKQIPVTAPKIPVSIVRGKGSVDTFTTNNANKMQFTAHSISPSVIRINKIYFPGWKVFVNNKEHAVSYANSTGLMDISLDAGNYFVVATFGETPIRYLADGISLVSLIFLLVFFLRPFTQRKALRKSKF